MWKPDWPISGEGRLLAEVKGKVGGKSMYRGRRRGRPARARFAKKSTWWVPIVGRAPPFSQSTTLQPKAWNLETSGTQGVKTIMSLAPAALRGSTLAGAEVIGEANRAVKILGYQGRILAWAGSDYFGAGFPAQFPNLSGTAMVNWLWMMIKYTGDAGSLTGGYPTSNFDAESMSPRPAHSIAIDGDEGDLGRLLARKDIHKWGITQVFGAQPAYQAQDEVPYQAFPQGTVSGVVYVGKPGNNENHWDGGARVVSIPLMRKGTVIEPGEALNLVVGRWTPMSGNMSYGDDATIYDSNGPRVYIMPQIRLLCCDA